MPPKRKPPAASPRKTRSMTTGKPAPPAPAKAKPEPENRGRKRAKTAAAAAVEEDGGALVGGGAGGEGGAGGAAGGKRVVVEACTQCRQFKIRALKVKEDLESAVPGVSVTINPEKPRRGCLEIREEGGEVFISLLNMPRPFTAMKKLDMDEVIKDIAKKVA